MPHLVVEHTAITGLDPQRVLEAAMAALAGTGEFDMSNTKGRIVALERAAVDHPDDGTGFVACRVSILDGRTMEQRRGISLAVTEAVAGALPTVSDRVQVTTEVLQMERETYTKQVLGG
ncbi:5-carboxymethyl-2-hydroxymuconate Delta-isomerase [Ornithinimicrobium pekingense]|uniref:5-carboxymethyl-2-hydroxymuconate isomerase n=1 Tax=Ornithinimicrobium pekingense TaxID=384677 RepID=A0ABQ2F8X5_9MICO|nr:5-carboxymethyl-2-hydroxymuconate isomerase [Ornithinimicrobium pekingense]GGK73050.1 hypothetical protein GCM10011509_22050 [Ornithinimicrobium pekingense]